ncbi:DUF3102 domain-containing protein [Sinorhizobium fredii]|uniref:DUF3102 domain-containing protein n=1 Tax=Rhizobium fredii TaxID=380 RepID=UPI0005957101|nr:DUF3102 domain-containing protein [Sinorhizobium fredii]WOS62161.1 DUF3102 domain-containing protein [Sinorhizobium fredii GR64]
MSNRLPVLAAEIRQAHNVMNSAARTAVDAAIVAGRSLIEAKELVGHGNWLPFLKDAGLHEKAAQRLMTLAASNLKSDMVSFLGGVTPALRFIAIRKQALQAYDEAEAELTAGGPGLEPLERAIGLIDDMVSMFPQEFLDEHRVTPMQERCS